MQLTKAGLIMGWIFCSLLTLSAQPSFKVKVTEGIADPHMQVYHAPSDSLQFTGRTEIKTDSFPRLWGPGSSVFAKFRGASCDIFVNDEVLYGTSHNYVEVIVDNNEPIRLKLTFKTNMLHVEGLVDSDHTLILCKNTEAGIGYIEFAGINCDQLLLPNAQPSRKIEFIGNSITCGAGMDLSAFACNQGQWYDQHNAWMSYGGLTARALHAQWQLSAVSGIGLIHSCCNMQVTMPRVFDKVNMRDDSIAWNFKRYTPDVVTICLGQNDGVQDSATFCAAYIYFIRGMRQHYPMADIVCLTSPMGDAYLNGVLKNYISAVVSTLNNSGDVKIHKYFFLRQYHNGCGGHPDLAEHRQIAAELTAYLKKLEHW
jgi:hypothetical protein